MSKSHSFFQSPNGRQSLVQPLLPASDDLSSSRSDLASSHSSQTPEVKLDIVASIPLKRLVAQRFKLTRKHVRAVEKGRASIDHAIKNFENKNDKLFRALNPKHPLYEPCSSPSIHVAGSRAYKVLRTLLDVEEKYHAIQQQWSADKSYLLSQEWQAYLEYYKQNDFEVVSWFNAETKDAIWNALATGFGTAGWMGVYYLKDYFQFAGLVGFFLHSFALGIGGLLAAPFVYAGELCKGVSYRQAFSTICAYAATDYLPDVIYQPLTDLIIAFWKADSLKEFSYLPYADPEFSAQEVLTVMGSFALIYGSLVYTIDKVFFNEAHEELPYKTNTTSLRLLHLLGLLFTGATGEAVSLVVQYDMFYSNDYFFNTDLEQGSQALLNLFYVCATMFGFSFWLDCVFAKATHMIQATSLARYNNQLIEVEPSQFVRRKDIVTINDDDYIMIDASELPCAAKSLIDESLNENNSQPYMRLCDAPTLFAQSAVCEARPQTSCSIVLHESALPKMGYH